MYVYVYTYVYTYIYRYIYMFYLEVQEGIWVNVIRCIFRYVCGGTWIYDLYLGIHLGTYI